MSEISGETIIKMPLWKQILLIISTITAVVSATYFISHMVAVDDIHSEDIRFLKETKVDKSEYYNNRQADKLTDSLSTQRKLNLIMKKLGIEEK